VALVAQAALSVRPEMHKPHGDGAVHVELERRPRPGCHWELLPRLGSAGLRCEVHHAHWGVSA